MKNSIYGATAACAVALMLSGCPGPQYPNCASDTDCASHTEFCVNGRCQQCRTDADCPEGQQCASGACRAIPGYCSQTQPCPSGQECQGNRCVAMAVTETPIEQPPPPPPGPCQLSAVYYEFESSDLSSSAQSTLQSNANCIRERNIARVQITGRADPRGTEEYNLALGDRRARAAAQYIQTLGVNRRAVGTNSRGEEDATGEDESGWANDRRSDVTER